MTLSHGFQVLQRKALSHLGGEFLQLRHESGATLLHLQTPDSSRVFTTSFYTPVPDDSGVAHVLEHLVLCGSRKYPSRKTFFEMQSRSLRDYMNASTTRDWTAFTFASSVPQDYWNLLDVYLDACFHPLLLDSSFDQEACRVTETGEYQGVVMNEMKGGMANAARVMREQVTRALFPGSAWARNSGGDPAAIVNLTADQVRDFHAEHYCAANTCFYSYGDVKLSDLLEKLDEVLKHVPVGQPAPRIEALNPPVSDLICTHPNTDQVLLVWKTVHQKEGLEHFALSLLTFILLGHTAAPLQKVLLKHGYALADCSGFHSETEEAVFAVGIKGTTDADLIEREVLACLREPVPNDLIQAALTRFELEDRDTGHAQVPYGVKLLFSVLGAHHHQASSAEACSMGGWIQQLRSMEDPSGFLQGLVQQHLMSQQPSRIVMKSGPAEQNLPELNPEDVAARLERQRTATPALDTCILPALKLEDLNPETPEVAHDLHLIAGVPVQQVVLAESGLTHLTLTVELSDLTSEQWELLTTYQVMLGRCGTEKQTFAALASSMQDAGAQWTPAVDIFHSPEHSGLVGAQLLIHLRGLSERIPQALETLGSWLAGLQFTAQEVQAVLKERIKLMENQMVVAGHQFAVLQASRRLNPALQWREQLDGLTALQTHHQHLQDPDLLDRLQDLHELLFQQSRMQVVICSKEDTGLQALPDFLARFPQGEAVLSQKVVFPETAASAPIWRQHIPSPVSFAAWIYRTVPYLHDDAPGMYLLARILHDHFHVQVREKGGAYGAMGRAAPEQGLLICASLRDPQAEATLKVFQQARQLAKDITPEQLYAAKLSSFRQIRPLVSSAAQARRTLMDQARGYTPQVRTAFMQRLLDTQLSVLPALAEKHLQGGAGAIIGPKAEEVPHVVAG
ncbi:insulinase family protein [Deinococcus roseus]|uniref:Metalloprotease n=1 Tax=Deinococcus roseus TaxID=392414 RepID=A0ABQ2DE36_9DEIO|nr:insulinase family protein [Deinococcus roseus]GGJ54845.1 metalloprotease [Deinococcus roseus]